MNIPIEAIFAMLAAEMFRALVEPEGLPPQETGIVVAVTAGWILFQYLVAASLAHRTTRRLRRAQGSTTKIVEDFRFRLVVQRVILVVLCIAHMHYTRWPTFVEKTIGLPHWSIIDDVIVMAPFVAAMAAGWMATYGADKMLSRRPWGLGEYVWFQARYSLLLVLLPWLVLKGVDDSREVWPPRVQDLSESIPVQVAGVALLAGVAIVFLPLFLRWLFRAVPMPPSDMRSRLEALAAKAGLRFRDVLVWRMDRARILNAGVMGIVPRFSYVLFSDALLESLTPAECEAVLGHEIGHTRKRHVLVYLVFTMGFVALAYDFMSFLPQGFRDDFLIGMPVIAILVTVYFRFIFGYLSRAFEREADVYAAGLLETPVPLVLALEKIALMSGDVRELRSWRHHSVAERVRYLSAVGFDKDAQARYHGRVKRVVWSVMLMVALFIAGAVYLSAREPEGLPAKIEFYKDMTKKQPWNDHPWVRLGEVCADHGDLAAAGDAFEEALEMNPQGPRARAGLMRLRLRHGRDEDRGALLAEASELARGLLAEDERSPTGFLLAAEVRMSARHGELYDPERAARLALDALAVELPKPRASTYETLARAILETGDVPAAAERVREGLERYPRNPALEALRARIAEADTGGV
ncbi:MAG: M48 family metalloprotease [Planctomycetota bacterium]|jgi:Zn-dependent protease with chaperone function